MPYALESERLSTSSTLGCCKSPHKVFIRLNLGTLLPLAFELVNSDQGEKEGEGGGWSVVLPVSSSVDGPCVTIRIRGSRVPPCGRPGLQSEQHVHALRYENVESISAETSCSASLRFTFSLIEQVLRVVIPVGGTDSGSYPLYLQCSTFMPHLPATCGNPWLSVVYHCVQPTVWGGQWYSEWCDWVFPSARAGVELWLADEDVSHLLLLVSTSLDRPPHTHWCPR